MPLPNSLTFSLQDVVDEVVPASDTLEGCFADAIDSLFDSRHRGDKDKLSNFRNYGWQGCFVYKDSEQINHPLVALSGVLGSNFYCFGAASDGYACAFQIDNNGALYELNTFATNGDPVDICAVTSAGSFKVFVITKGYKLINRSVLYSLQFDGSTWTELDNVESVYGGISPPGYKYKKVTADPVNQFVFCSGDPNDNIIDVYSWDSNGDLTLEHTNDMPEPIGDITWMSGGYLVVTFERGSSYTYVRTYSVNSSGVLTLETISLGSPGDTDILAIENNGEDISMYVVRNIQNGRWYFVVLELLDESIFIHGDLFYGGVNTPPSYSPNTDVMVFLGQNTLYGRKINYYNQPIGNCYASIDDAKLVYAGFNGAWTVVYTEKGSTYTLHSYEII